MEDPPSAPRSGCCPSTRGNGKTCTSDSGRQLLPAGSPLQGDQTHPGWLGLKTPGPPHPALSVPATSLAQNTLESPTKPGVNSQPSQTPSTQQVLERM